MLLVMCWDKPISNKFAWAYCAPWIHASSILVFLLFTKIKIANKACVSFLASSSLSVYLIHENLLINHYTYIHPLRYLESWLNNDALFIMLILVYSMFLYLAISTFDIVRQKLQTLLFNMLEKNRTYNHISLEIIKVFK